uniref:Uncharacterized protein n=1 Tax=Arundo donax TaxID=35708 RepID=A0A0A9HJJ1_ARUDO
MENTYFDPCKKRKEKKKEISFLHRMINRAS